MYVTEVILSIQPCEILLLDIIDMESISMMTCFYVLYVTL